MSVPKDAITVSLIVATMTLVGVVVGASITAGVNYLLAVRKEAAETRNWRRDHALEAYTDVLKGCATVRFETTAAYIAECYTEEQVKHSLLITAAIEELHALVDRVLLLSPKEMYDAIRNLASCSGELGAKSIQCPKIPSTEWDTIGRRYTAAFVDFFSAARNELGIHKPHLTAEEWRKETENWKRDKTT